jgi:hypothetical protein
LAEFLGLAVAVEIILNNLFPKLKEEDCKTDINFKPDPENGLKGEISWLLKGSDCPTYIKSRYLLFDSELLTKENSFRFKRNYADIFFRLYKLIKKK